MAQPLLAGHGSNAEGEEKEDWAREGNHPEMSTMLTFIFVSIEHKTSHEGIVWSSGAVKNRSFQLSTLRCAKSCVCYILIFQAFKNFRSI